MIAICEGSQSKKELPYNRPSIVIILTHQLTSCINGKHVILDYWDALEESGALFGIGYLRQSHLSLPRDTSLCQDEYLIVF